MAEAQSAYFSHGDQMRTSIINQLVMNGGVVVAEVPSVRAGWRTWIAIHGVSVAMLLNPMRPPGVFYSRVIDLDKVPSDKKFIFTLKKVSVDEKYLRNGWDVGGNEVIDIFRAAYSFEELMGMVSELAVDTNDFIEVWNSDYPL